MSERLIALLELVFSEYGFIALMLLLTLGFVFWAFYKLLNKVLDGFLDKFYKMLNLTQEHTEEHKIIFKMLTDNGIVLRKHLKLMEEHHDLMEIQHEMVKNCTNIIKNK